MVLLATVGAMPSAAQAEPENLKVARYFFDSGTKRDYAEALRLVDELLARHQLADETDLREAYRIQGLSHFYLGHVEEARTSFVSLLSVDPDFTLDPLYVPPLTIVEFDRVKRDNEALLKPIRDQRRAIAEQRKIEELARRKLIEEEERRRREQVSGPVVMQRVEHHPLLTNFLPFGAAQLDQDRNAVAAMLAIGQGLGLATSVLAYTQMRGFVGTDSKVALADLNRASNWQVANRTAFTISIAFYLGGVIDAFLHYQPQTVSYTAVPREQIAPPRPAAPSPSIAPAPAAPAPAAPLLPSPSVPVEKPRGGLYLTPLPGGAAAGVSFSF